jgi:uncharacterized protein YaiL (DUF2058 family)
MINLNNNRKTITKLNKQKKKIWFKLLKRGVVKKILKSKRVNRSNNMNLIMYNFGSGKKVKLINYIKSCTVVSLRNRGNDCVVMV